MTPSCRLVALTTVILAFATTASAAVLYSPPLSSGASHLVACRVTNASTKPREIRLDMLQANGSIALTTNVQTVQPGGFANLGIGGNFIYSCRVTSDGGKGSVRAQISVEQQVATGDFVTIFAMPFE